MPLFRGKKGNQYSQFSVFEELEPRRLLASGGLLQQTDFSYQGAFRLPGGSFGGSTFEYGGTALAFNANDPGNPNDDTLFIVGHDHHQMVAEVSIPSIVNSTNRSALSTAKVVQPFADVSDGLMDRQLEDNVKIGGLLVDNGQLIWTAYEYYDGDVDARFSHGTSPLSLSGGNDAQGMFRVGTSVNPGFYAGYMTHVPEEWLSTFGRPVLTGQSILGIISRTSAGPALFGFDPTNFGSSPAPSTPFVYYLEPGTPEQRLANMTSKNSFINFNSHINGVVFPGGTSSVVFFGGHGTGDVCYGTPEECNDSDRGGKGWHDVGGNYVYYAWAYDAADLLAVKNGQMQPWQVRPYAVWELDLPFASGNRLIGGAAYDPHTGRVFVSQQYGDGPLPVIHVFQIQSTPDTTVPVISNVQSTNVTAVSAAISWTTNEPADSRVEYWPTSNPSIVLTVASPSSVTNHSLQLGGLQAATSYGYRVVSKDSAGNATTTSAFTFTTATTDTTGPVLSSINSSNVSFDRASITWTTNEPADSRVEYWQSTTPANWLYVSSTTRVTSHTLQLIGLQAETSYGYRVISQDSSGNTTTSSVFTFTTAAGPTTAGTWNWDNPEPLPAIPGGAIVVSNVSQLISAVNNLKSNQTISIQPGTYNLAGVTNALYVPQGISNWAIRGATGNRDEVVIKGAGMNGSVQFGFWIGNSPRGTIADLTLDGIREHGIIANPGAHELLIHNLRMVDVGDQHVKSNPNGFGNGNNNGKVQYSVFEYRTTDTDDYTNGVDVHGGDGWIVHHSLFRNFLSPAGQPLAGPAVLMWTGSTGSVIEGNTFINVARGISLGYGDDPAGFDHQGGIIRNNFFYRDSNLASRVDVPIMVADSPGTEVYHNTLITRGSYPNAIEYRYSSSSGIDIRNNLTDAAIVARDGANGTRVGNVTSAGLSLFQNPSAGDLHLLSGATVIDLGSSLPDVATDIDGQARDSKPDIGADEFRVASNVNNPPVVQDQAFVVAQGSPVGTLVGQVSAIDPDGDPLTYTIAAGNAGGALSLHATTGIITVANASALVPSTFVLTVTVSDGKLSDSGKITVNVSKVNKPPSISSQTFAMAENSSSGTIVGTVAATDPDGDSLNFLITAGNTSGAFAVSSTGAITVASGAVLDYEAAPVHWLTIAASDGKLTGTATLTINVLDVNEAPVVINQSFSVPENAAVGTLVGIVQASDPEGDSLRFYISSRGSSNAFAMDVLTGAIRVADQTALNQAASHTRTLYVFDGKLVSIATFTINVTNVNRPPVVSNQAFSIADNAASGALIGTVNANDPDGDELSYTITAGNELGAFAIKPLTGAITVANTTALNQKTTHNLTVAVSDGQQSASATVTISVLAKNGAPTVADQVFLVAENAASGTFVGVVQASDPDGDALSYSIIAGNSSGAFRVGEQSGTISVANASVIDYELTPSYTLTIRVSDGQLSDTATIVVNVIDVNEVPVASVVGRHIFYNQSSYDGGDAAAGSADDAAIAPDKVALLPGQTASFANYTSYSRGINGIMVDIQDLTAASLTMSDFALKVGNDNNPNGWQPAPAPSSITARAIGPNVTRVTILWPNNVIVGKWLQITAKANANTGLLVDDVHYWGNAIGETGNVPGSTAVDSGDVDGVMNNIRWSGLATLDNPFDFNRDRTVSVSDVLIASAWTHSPNSLALITAPVLPSLAAAAAPMPADIASAVDGLFARVETGDWNQRLETGDWRLEAGVPESCSDECS